MPLTMSDIDRLAAHVRECVDRPERVNVQVPQAIIFLCPILVSAHD